MVNADATVNRESFGQLFIIRGKIPSWVDEYKEMVKRTVNLFRMCYYRKLMYTTSTTLFSTKQYMHWAKQTHTRLYIACIYDLYDYFVVHNF